MRRDRVIAVVAGIEETDREDVLDVLRCRQSVIEGLVSRGFRAFPVDIAREDLAVKGRVARKLRENSPTASSTSSRGSARPPTWRSGLPGY